jgi:hypothetical protein
MTLLLIAALLIQLKKQKNARSSEFLALIG